MVCKSKNIESFIDTLTKSSQNITNLFYTSNNLELIVVYPTTSVWSRRQRQVDSLAQHSQEVKQWQRTCGFCARVCIGNR